MEKLVEALRRLCLTVNYCLCLYVFLLQVQQEIEGSDANDIGLYIFIFCIFGLVSLVIHFLINWIFLKKRKDD